MNKQIRNIFFMASPLEGEMTFMGTDILNNSIIGLIKNQILSLYNNIKGIFKNKRKKTLIIVMSSVWFFLIILKSLNINFIFLDIANYLTFSFGGFIGKTIMAYFVTSLVLPNQEKFQLIKNSKSFIKEIKFKDKNFIVFSLMGIGLSLIGYNFLSGGIINNSVIGLVSIVMLLKTLNRKTGLIREGLSLVLSKTKLIKDNSSSKINMIIIGSIVGALIGILISLLGHNLCYIIGLIILVISIVLNFIIIKQKK